ncbi:hypothetical protein M413DRAFT_30301 [Hebeloma cylindrosporum]|uniref:Uncharacterized protein n=1 Tax=Hebeloma cylindrosporum TaxID=76867 RepID=A0A0C3BNE3_HEBCY|nr:hypothetical protein M413DRAFT_30301 [Hebeloma cylindrosporum h7]
MTDYVTDSPELRLHIRNLLHDYSLSHYTTNYLTFTEDLVSEFIEDLKPIPLTDPYSLVRPVDPFDALSQLHGIGSLEPYDEIPQTTNDARSYLKNVMGATRGKPKSERVVWDDGYGLDPPFEPIFPALTRRARQSTTKLGAKPKAQPVSYKNLLKSQDIHILSVEPIQEENLVPEDVLQANLQIDSTDLPHVRALIQKTTDMRRLHKSHKNKYLDPDFLRKDLSPTMEWPEEPFIPIFPRSRLIRSGVAPSTQVKVDRCKSFVDIPSAVVNKIEVEDPDGDLSRQNLVIVDGWETIRSSPPSSRSSKHSDGEDQLDELFLLSSPNTEPSNLEELVKMEEIIMPRSRRIGGSSGIAPHILAGKTLGSFLAPLLPPTNQISAEASTSKEGNACHMRSSPTPSSLLGQPPSVLELDTTNTDTNIQDQDLDVGLKRLYKGQELNNLIMNEAIDDKQDMLMEVPALPAPNIHQPNGMQMAKSFSEFVVPVNASKKAKGGPPPEIHRCLKKVKGCQSLGIALSWVPFTVDKKLPTVSELIGVNDLFDTSCAAEQEESVEVQALLKFLNLGDDDVQVLLVADAARFASFDDSRTYRPCEAFDDFQIVMSRQERQRLATSEGRIWDQKPDDTQDDVGEVGLAQSQDTFHHDHLRHDSQGIDDERPHKRPRIENNSVEGPAIMLPSTDLNSIHDRPWCESNSPTLFDADDDNKENWPPLSSSLSRLMDETEDYQTYSDGFLDSTFEPNAFADEGTLGRMEDQQESFEPLSFGSRQPPSQAVFVQREAHGLDAPPGGQDMFAVEYVSEDVPMDEKEDSLQERGLALTLASEPDIASQPLGIFAFAHLRAKKVSEHLPDPVVEPIPVPVPAVISNEKQSVPPDLFDQNTLRLPDAINPAQSVHRYMASLEFIQKHALVRALRSSECSVELVERQTLGGVDLIVDPHCAIIFLSLFTLAARCDIYTERISQQSWKFSRLLVIFEAYPEQRSKRSFMFQNRGSTSASSLSELYAFTPPIVKAIKKFRRDVSIADACGTKCGNTRVEYAFANTVNEAASLTRWFGERAEEAD